MLKFSILSLASMLLFASASESAIIIAGDLDEAEQEKVDSVLRTYTGPAPKFLDIEAKHLHPDVPNILLNKSIPFAEVEFLKSYFQRENITATVAYIPSTIWNLHVIHKYLTDKSAQDSYLEIHELPGNHKDYFKAPYARYFKLSKELMGILETQDVKDTQYFVSLSNAYLRYINQHTLIDTEWSRALNSELKKINSNIPSILHKMIGEEMEAGEKNEILLVRATAGFALKDKAQTKEECKKTLQSGWWSKQKIQSRATKDRLSYEEALEKMVNETFADLQWYKDLEPQGRALDFPCKGGTSAWGAINEFQTDIKTQPFQSGKNLSYADSLLNAYLFDSFNRVKSACSFEYFSKNSKTTLYTLHLNKKWLFSQGHNLFYFSGKSLETDGIFGSQENFHPRLRSVSTANQGRMGVKISNDQIHPDCLTIDSSLPPAVLGNLTPEKQEEIKIFQYTLQANEIISQARVISFNGEILDPQHYPQEVIEILKNQKHLSTLLQEKILPIL